MSAANRIFEALDARNYKQALKLAEKNEKNNVCRALKAVALQRLGRYAEADAA
eukprot:CAMPEP_0119279404 /NCGR_PEP_ID=MMETSP1329-20130426/20740_1 /TAXON_ID=114041 /ORGANISM="Genus nov. species nov., Strain RCC1024" /LENGTH=52 /DNA_ID=CAMNT_0007279945 /DNA_START=62 /DNA_END=216 /DNA_ORIENTATION=+